MKSENNEDNRNAESRTVSSAGGARRQVPRQKNAGSRTRQYRGGKNRQDKLFRPSVKKTAAGGVQYPQVEEKPEITIDDFDKIQIRVGEVLKCEPVPKAKKLLVSQIRIGDEVRQIVSGIAKYYKPEEMVGKKVAVITNLKPCKLCGVESQGMILAAADDADNLSVLTVDKDMIAGSEIR